MSRTRRRGRKRGLSASQIIFWVLGLLVALSMILGLFLSFQPPPPPPPEPTSTPTEEPALPTPTREPDLPAPRLTPTPVPLPSPTPSAQAKDRFAFAVCGDTRGGEEIFSQIRASALAEGCDFLIHLGDMVHQGTREEFAAFSQTMADFPLPFYPVPGNHDGVDLEAYLTYSGAPDRHYSFQRGQVHFIMADSHLGGLNKEELRWIEEELRGSERPVKMVFLHHPPFDPQGGDHIMAWGNQAFMDLMAKYEVDYVFAGHIHAYAEQERDGTKYIITGGGGASLYASPESGGFYHYILVKVQGETVEAQVVRIGD